MRKVEIENISEGSSVEKGNDLKKSKDVFIYWLFILTTSGKRHFCRILFCEHLLFPLGILDVEEKGTTSNLLQLYHWGRVLFFCE